MKNKLNKTIYSGRGILKYIVVILLITACSYAKIPQDELTEIRNKLCYVGWAVNAVSILSNPNEGDFFKPKQSHKRSKYRESIINVIGHAIADCLTMQKEFALKQNQTRVITFDAEPSLYQRKHWNAVILYNYIDLMLHRDHWQERDSGEKFELIKSRISNHYTQFNIPDLEQKLKTSIEDIKKYCDKLNLENYLANIENIISEPDLEDRITTLAFDMKLEDLEQLYNQDKETIFRMNNRINNKANCYVNFGTNRNVEFKTVELKYDPKESEGNKWSLVDNGTLEVNSLGKQFKGHYRVASGCFTNIWQQLMQFVECDLELDISELQDYHIWRSSPCTMNYIGKKSGLIKVLDPNDEQYRDLSPEEQTHKWNEENFKNRYESYRSESPRNHPWVTEE